MTVNAKTLRNTIWTLAILFSISIFSFITFDYNQREIPSHYYTEYINIYNNTIDKVTKEKDLYLLAINDNHKNLVNAKIILDIYTELIFSKGRVDLAKDNKKETILANELINIKKIVKEYKEITLY